jgi:hypothetical protein
MFDVRQKKVKKVIPSKIAAAREGMTSQGASGRAE